MGWKEKASGVTRPFRARPLPPPCRLGGMRLGLSLGACLLPLAASAGDIELAAYAGPAVPFYSQTFNYDPGTLVSPFRLITIQQQGVFQLEAKGGLAFGGGIAWYVLGPVGLEARIDTAGADVRTTGARYRVSVALPAPLPPLSTDLDLGTGTVNLDRLRPLSLNVKIRTPGSVRLTVSGGASYLPAFGFGVTETLGLGVTGLGPQARIDVATLAFGAQSVDEGHWGWNAGGGLQVKLARHVALLAEARYFQFGEETLGWSRADPRPLSRFEEALLQEIERRLPPVVFAPKFFQVTAGIAVGF
jgi:opacity protein-like surface antigen